jgi:hypothetical protein
MYLGQFDCLEVDLSTEKKNKIACPSDIGFRFIFILRGSQKTDQDINISDGKSKTFFTAINCSKNTKTLSLKGF